MGIQGLLPLLKSIMKPIHIKDLEGCCVAIDTYSWLHKGALSCSTDLCKGLPTSRHIEYCMHRVNLLRHYGVKPVLVFDGGLLPMKIEQENKRAKARKENLARAIECESDGNSSAAYEFYQKAVDISPSIAHELIQVLRQENVCYVVAPYEADAQMTFLAISKQVDAVITEDSDLIAFGCPRIIFKMDKFGQGVEFQYSMLPKNKDLSLAGFTEQMLLEMCILSGCDYLPSLPGMGLKRAHALISKFKSYEKVIKHLRYSTVSVPPLYEESFKKAVLTFQHQRVYDPVNENIVHLSNISDNVGLDLDFLGPYPLFIIHLTSKGIAEGDIDPFTQLPFQGWSDSSELALDRKSHYKSFKPESERKKLDLPVQKNLLTKYFCFASLEAKRKFCAPRISPQNLSPGDTFSLSSGELAAVEAGYSEKNCSLASPVNSENVGNVSPLNNFEKSCFASEVPLFSESMIPDMVDERSTEHTLLPQYGRLIHKPGLALQKEFENKNLTDAAEGKTRKDSGKLRVRSSYFQHKQVNKNDQGNEQETFLVKNDDALQKVCESKNLMDAAEGKTRKANRKVIIRSPYFQPKQVNENDPENEQEKLLVKDYDATDQENKQEKLLIEVDVANDMSENVDTENSLSVSYPKCTTFKRKASANNSVQTVSSFTCMTCYCDHNLDKTFLERKKNEAKFGSNISHLGRYSEIAEKSVERFVSVISSYRYSSGSRASGLRAPLRDVHNTCTNRSSAVVDFSQFAYVPKNQKSALGSRKI
ncbi:hypothetical protein Ddye_024407 [Dipteronia dyeriana]|uniref:Exonuclease 1 n=1 Tax=Dipteronia dyeriana TaxID=168575 RepID=A0AAD9WSY0_9ROSI|nr:hypothetical protein Ddye_024407 [Dipteronia dyeriana]